MAQENKSKSKSNSQRPAEVLQALANAGQSKFIKFADGQTMKLHFYPELTTMTETTINGKRDKPTTRFKFMNTTMPPTFPWNNKMQRGGKQVAKELNDYFNENKVDFQITRIGLDTSTKCRIIPITVQRAEAATP